MLILVCPLLAQCSSKSAFVDETLRRAGLAGRGHQYEQILCFELSGLGGE